MGKKNVIVLGCGLIGETMAKDLARDDGLAVTAADIREENLAKLAKIQGIRILPLDLSDTATLRKAIEPFDVVVGALPSRIGLETLRTVIEAGKPYADISFMPEDALQLDRLAKKHGVTALVDAGVSPGLSNLCVGHAVGRLATVERAVIYVGGLPKHPQPPFFYKAPFAPSDVLEEYTRPARLIEKGKVVTRPALSEPEIIEFPRAGKLEAFNTDGLRSLLNTMDIPDMVEKTLRHPGHIDVMRVFRETGLFDKNLLDVGGVSVRPLDVTATLLFPKWTYEPDQEEFTVLQVLVDGFDGDRRLRYRYDLYDEYDAETGTSSMARTTGYPCTILARQLARGEWTEAGVIPLEFAARVEGLFEHIVEELGVRGVELRHEIIEL